MYLIINLLAGISSRSLTVERVFAFSTALSRNSCALRLMTGQSHNHCFRVAVDRITLMLLGHHLPALVMRFLSLASYCTFFGRSPCTCFSFGSFFCRRKEREVEKNAAKSLKFCEKSRARFTDLLQPANDSPCYCLWCLAPAAVCNISQGQMKVNTNCDMQNPVK